MPQGASFFYLRGGERMTILTEENVQTLLQLSERQTRALFQREDFPGFRVGKQYRVAEDELLTYLKESKDIKLDYGKT